MVQKLTTSVLKSQGLALVPISVRRDTIFLRKTKKKRKKDSVSILVFYDGILPGFRHSVQKCGCYISDDFVKILHEKEFI